MMKRAFALILISLMAGAQQIPEGLVKFEATTNLVVVNVAIKDKSGKAILGLKKEDFAIYEDEKRQNISVFEFQNLNTEALPEFKPEETSDTEESVLKPQLDTEPKAKDEKKFAPGELRYKDRRLLVMFFDMSSMKADAQLRSQQSALKFIETQMTASDLVSIMTFAGSLTVDVDFTEDRQELYDAINALPIGEMIDFAEPGSTDDDTSADEGDDSMTLFTADDSEFNIFNTDRKLSALEAATKYLATLPEKKALIYFSSGVGKTGVENQAQLRATINWAVKSNVAFYPVDARGLVAMPPAGGAAVGAVKGTAIYSGQVHRSQGMKNIDAQETLFSLAADTGGKALLDNNDLSMGIVQAQKDINSYYIIGYYSTNGAQDGKFRKIRVKLANSQSAKLEYRPGYFANKVWKDFTTADKERQLEEAMQAKGTPRTEIPIALETDFFRITSRSYFVPVAIKIPSSVVGFAKKGKDQTAVLDFMGKVIDSKGKSAGSVRDAIKIKLTDETATNWSKKPIEYDTGFALVPGKYTIKFLARENTEGRIGTFETKFEIPDLKTSVGTVRMSSIIWGNQRQALTAALASASNDKKTIARHPLIQDNQKLVPNITHVFRRNQNLYVYFEVYDPRIEDDKQPSVAATLSLFRGGVKAYESTPVRVTELATNRTQTVPFQFQLPLKDLGPGEYTCQLNVIDELGKRFAFPRAPLVLLP